MEKTPFAGLTALQAAESLLTDGGSFTQRNPYITDLLLRVGAQAHRHDAHPPLADPQTPPGVTTLTDGGQLPADSTIGVAYTLLDSYGGETLPSPIATIATPAPVEEPTYPADLDIDYTAGALVADWYSYVVTLIDDAGGETTPSPVATIRREGGTVNARITISGLGGMVTGSPGATGWRLFRAKGTGEFDLITTGDATDDSFVDDGSTPADCSQQPPTTNTTHATSAIVVNIPAIAVTGAAGWRLYVAYDGDFSRPSLYGAVRAPAEAGSGITVAALDVDEGTPPDVSTAIAGADKINADTDILNFHWKPPVADAAALPTEDNENGDIRQVLADHSLHAWDGSAWVDIAGGGGIGGGAVSVSDGFTRLDGVTDLLFSHSEVTDLGAHTAQVDIIGAGGEAVGAMYYRGVYDPGTDYDTGSVVKYSDGLYVAGLYVAVEDAPNGGLDPGAPPIEGGGGTGGGEDAVNTFDDASGLTAVQGTTTVDGAIQPQGSVDTVFSWSGGPDVGPTDRVVVELPTVSVQDNAWGGVTVVFADNTRIDAMLGRSPFMGGPTTRAYVGLRTKRTGNSFVHDNGAGFEHAPLQAATGGVYLELVRAADRATANVYVTDPIANPSATPVGTYEHLFDTEEQGYYAAAAGKAGGVWIAGTAFPISTLTIPSTTGGDPPTDPQTNPWELLIAAGGGSGGSDAVGFRDNGTDLAFRPWVNVTGELLTAEDDGDQIVLSTPTKASIVDELRGAASGIVVGTDWLELELTNGATDVTTTFGSGERRYAPHGCRVDAGGTVYLRGRVHAAQAGKFLTLPELGWPAHIKHVAAVADDTDFTVLTVDPTDGSLSCTVAGDFNLDVAPWESAIGGGYSIRQIADTELTSGWTSDPADPLVVFLPWHGGHRKLRGTLHTTKAHLLDSPLNLLTVLGERPNPNYLFVADPGGTITIDGTSYELSYVVTTGAGQPTTNDLITFGSNDPGYPTFVGGGDTEPVTIKFSLHEEGS